MPGIQPLQTHILKDMTQTCVFKDTDHTSKTSGSGDGASSGSVSVSLFCSFALEGYFDIILGRAVGPHYEALISLLKAEVFTFGFYF